VALLRTIADVTPWLIDKLASEMTVDNFQHVAA
jgi:hypothetical protein